jgi:hypothetical protein
LQESIRSDCGPIWSLDHCLSFPKYPFDQLALSLSLLWHSRLRIEVDGDLHAGSTTRRSSARGAHERESIPSRCCALGKLKLTSSECRSCLRQWGNEPKMILRYGDESTTTDSARLL